MVRRLVQRCMAFCAVFALLTPLLPVMDTRGKEAGSTVDALTMADGFLLKPSIATAQSDRVGGGVFAYTVEPGDTLSTIAEAFDLKKETLLMENDMDNANRLRVGSTIRVLAVDGVSHKVAKGDTLGSIAKKYTADAEAIRRQNKLEGDAISVGAVLVVPGGKKAVVRPAVGSFGGRTYAGLKASASNPGRFIFPTDRSARITQMFRAGHYALDIAKSDRPPIYAAAAGVVIQAEKSGWNGGYGNVIIIDHGNGLKTLYGHNSEVYVGVGQTVNQGDAIARMGRTGRVYGRTGIHVHFEVILNGAKQNPLNFF